MENAEVVTQPHMLFSLFDTTLYFGHSINETKVHSFPMRGVTKQELQFLAFLHGHECFKENEIVFAGKAPVVLQAGSPPLPNGEVDPNGVPTIYCQSERDDLKRIARKYDKIIDPGVGVKRVEACFGVRLDGFENMVETVNAKEAAGAAAERAERAAAAAAVSSGAARASEIRPQEPETNPDRPDPALERAVSGQSIGDRVFGAART